MIQGGRPGVTLPEPVAAVNSSFPVMERLANYLTERKTLSGLRIGWHCHLTWLTALALEPALRAGAHVFLSECNQSTTQPEAVDYMSKLGAAVFLGSDSCRSVLAQHPQVLSDTGLDLISCYIGEPTGTVRGASEITTSGIARLRLLGLVPLPVININDSRLKTRIENFHGVGAEFLGALKEMTGMDWNGRKAAVVGYGQVGAGVAAYLKKSGALVTVVEADPVSCLIAHYDGFCTGSLRQVLAESELVVTATGQSALLGKDEWLAAADGLYVFNVGHWSLEVSPQLLKELSVSSRKTNEFLEEFEIPGAAGEGTKRVILAAGGNPANIVVSSPAPEPTLIHLTTELLSLEFLASLSQQAGVLTAGELPVPDSVQRTAALMALQALGLAV